MKKITFVLIGFFFITYWFATILCVMPDNYIKLTHYRNYLKFDSFFKQKWAFFAPPPQSNDRLIYEFEDSNGLKTMVEVLEDINLNKSDKMPFNANEDILEYVIAGSFHGITQYLAKHPDIVRNRKNIHDTITIKKVWKTVDESGSVKTLINYGGIVAQKNNINFDSIQIILSDSKIRKFANRMEVDSVIDNELSTYYKSRKFSKNEIVKFGSQQ